MKRAKWTQLLDNFAALRVGGSYMVVGDQRFANRLRGMLHISNRTMLWKWTVRRDGEAWRVTKTGKWKTYR